MSSSASCAACRKLSTSGLTARGPPCSSASALVGVAASAGLPAGGLPPESGAGVPSTAELPAAGLPAPPSAGLPNAPPAGRPANAGVAGEAKPLGAAGSEGRAVPCALRGGGVPSRRSTSAVGAGSSSGLSVAASDVAHEPLMKPRAAAGGSSSSPASSTRLPAFMPGTHFDSLLAVFAGGAPMLCGH